MPHEPPRSRRAWAWTAALVVGLAGWTALTASLDSGHVGVLHDDGLYLASARSLRDGRGYGLPGRPGGPPPKYPIGLPAAIALALRLDPAPGGLAREVAIGRGIVLASGWAFFGAAFAWLRRVGVGEGWACGIVLATAFHHVTLIGGATAIFADLPFAALAYGLLCRWAGRGARGEATGFGDGLIAGLATLVRSNGVTLIGGALVASALGPRPRRAVLAALAGAAIAVGPATWYAGRHPRAVPSGDYRLELRAGYPSPAEGVRVVARNARSMALDEPTRVLASPAAYLAPVVGWTARHPAAWTLFRVGVSGLVLVGAVALARTSRKRDLPAWTHAAGSLAIFAVWPWNGIMDRFLLSLMPMTILAFLRGLEVVGRAAGLAPRPRRLVASVGLGLVVAGNVAVAGRSAAVFLAHGRQWAGASDRGALEEAYRFLRDHTPADAVVAAVWPEAAWLQTGRMAVPLVEDESFLIGRFGDVGRLLLWREQVPGRPFLLLVRGPDEDPRGSDLAQVDALAARPGVTLREIFRTRDGRYRVIEATLSK